MKRTRMISSVALLSMLLGCQEMTNDAAPDSPQHGRYSGIGIYAPSKLWAEQTAAQPKAKQDLKLATVADDEQIIVVVDGKTGEVRECGNYSGYCASIQPWTKVVETGPVKLAKHADEVDAARAANLDKAEADNTDAKPQPTRTK